MKLNTAPANKVEFGNVTTTGEFRIRNSAKAFNILSSGLYANKIRAILRELGCNAYDSHVENGNAGVPFDLHLPHELEPWFSIRDYGTGLDDQQVKDIYTTYFESTKTESNDYVGALGLGSKTPFSYTENFTIIAIKNGVKRVYSAFVNDEGIPSVADMGTSETDEPSGVEIKFPVNEAWDFRKFREEASQVYTHFAVKPNILGHEDFKYSQKEYEMRDVIPGVHVLTRRSSSVAVMGNIEYPIDIPRNQEVVTPEIQTLLNHGVEMHFEISELDFQASREGLSYIPQTINAIVSKAQQAIDAMEGRLQEQVGKIRGTWNKIDQLNQMSEIWPKATFVQNNLKLKSIRSQYNNVFHLLLSTTEAEKFNIKVSVLEYDPYRRGGYAVSRGDRRWGEPGGNFRFGLSKVERTLRFVVSDKKTGVLARSKFHYSSEQNRPRTLITLSPIDKDKPMRTAAFFRKLDNPPKKIIVQADELRSVPKPDRTKTTYLTAIAPKWDQKDMVWEDVEYDPSITAIYIKLKGFQQASKCGVEIPNIKDTVWQLSRASMIDQPVYGVRQKDWKKVEKNPNYTSLEDFIIEAASRPDVKASIIHGMIMEKVGYYNQSLVDWLYPIGSRSGIERKDSPIVKYSEMFEPYVNQSDRNRFARIIANMSISVQMFSGYNEKADEIIKQLNTVTERYPLLRHLEDAKKEDIVDYINLVDSTKE